MRVNRRMLYLQYTSPSAYPPLEHSSQLLVDNGWEVLFLGVSKDGDPPLHWAERTGVSTRELSPSRSGWLRKLHYARFALLTLLWVARWRPNWVYASDVFATPVALLLSWLPGMRLVYHEHDRPLLTNRTLASTMLARARRMLARRASVRVLPNGERAREFVEGVGRSRPTLTVWNCPLTSEVSPPRAQASGEGLDVVYVGSIVPARLPASVIEALAMLPETVRLRAIGYTTAGYPDYVRALKDLAKRRGIGHRVAIEDGMPHPELLRSIRHCDVGLALISTSNDRKYAQWMPGASNKPFDYLASGLALLVADQPGWREMYVEPAYGLACEPEDPHSVEKALRWFLEHPTEMRAMGERGRERIVREWNYDTQFAPVLAGLGATG
jgi:glycosyltransferase involved in cell wall biosynthesis